MFVPLFCQKSAFKRSSTRFVHYTALIMTGSIVISNEERQSGLVIILGSQSILATILQGFNADAALPAVTQQEVSRDTSLDQKRKTQVS